LGKVIKLFSIEQIIVVMIWEKVGEGGEIWEKLGEARRSWEKLGGERVFANSFWGAFAAHTQLSLAFLHNVI